MEAYNLFTSAPTEAVRGKNLPRPPPPHQNWISGPILRVVVLVASSLHREVDAKAWEFWAVSCTSLRSLIPLPTYERLYTRPVRSVILFLK